MILSVISTSNCHRLKLCHKNGHCASFTHTALLLSRMHHVMTTCFQIALPYLVKKVGGSTDGPCDWTPSGHPHTLHMSKE